MNAHSASVSHKRGFLYIAEHKFQFSKGSLGERKLDLGLMELVRKTWKS